MRSLFRKLGRLLRLAALISIIVAIGRAVMGRRQPDVTGEASWPPLADDAPPTSARSTGTTATAATADKTATKKAATAEKAATRKASAATSTNGSGKRAATPRTVVADSSTKPWVEPADGACPASHPIKGNAQSKIFHVPGGASYDRTVAERCYLSAEAAEADGFRAAKR